MNFKRILALFLAAVLSLSFFSCRKVDKGDKDEGGKDKNDATEVIDYSAPAVWSDTTTVTHSMFIYYYWKYLYDKGVFFSYENGTTVYVNYGTADATADGISIPAGGYTFNGGENA